MSDILSEEVVKERIRFSDQEYRKSYSKVLQRADTSPTYHREYSIYLFNTLDLIKQFIHKDVICVMPEETYQKIIADLKAIYNIKNRKDVVKFSDRAVDFVKNNPIGDVRLKRVNERIDNANANKGYVNGEGE